MNKRDELSAEITRTVPLPQLIAAAASMFMRGKVGEVSTDDLAAFIESLDVAGLEELRRMALAIEGGVVQ